MRDITTITKELRKNEEIRVPELRLIDETETMIGVVSRDDALRRARENGLDLVEVSPKADPPVAKIIDYGAYIFQQEKAERKSKKKQKRVDIKGIRISFKMGEHDRSMRLKQAQKFLNQGDKVKVELIMRGREKAHKDLATQKIEAFISELGISTRREQELGRQGNRLTVLIAKD